MLVLAFPETINWLCSKLEFYCFSYLVICCFQVPKCREWSAFFLLTSLLELNPLLLSLAIWIFSEILCQELKVFLYYIFVYRRMHVLAFYIRMLYLAWLVYAMFSGFDLYSFDGDFGQQLLDGGYIICLFFLW